MERFVSGDAASFGAYVSWEEVNVARSGDRGRREVRYYLKRIDGGADLAVIGKEKSLRHMSYYFALTNHRSLLPPPLPPKLRTRREVVDWLNGVVSDSLSYGFTRLQNSSAIIDAPELDIETFKDIESRKLGHHSREILWLGTSWTCKKRRKHYQCFCRNGVTISVNDFVHVLAEEDKRLVAYLEDMYEDAKGNRMVVVRWFHKTDEVGIVLPHKFNDREIYFSLCLQDLSIECIDGLATVLSPEHFKKFLRKAVQTSLNPYFCDKQLENDDVKLFDITRVEGYWRQYILRYMHVASPSTDQVNSQQSPDLKVERVDDASVIRPMKRHRGSKDSNICSGNTELTDGACLNVHNLHSCWVERKSGNETSSFREESAAVLCITEAKQNPLQYLKVGSEVEVLSQDSGIRGYWFRASIIKKHKDKVKVRYHDLNDAADENAKLEEWILSSRVAVPDELGIRLSGRTIVRPFPQISDGVSGAVDVGTAVDVWWHDSWCEGIVIQKESEDRIRVYFPGEKKDAFFCRADLRRSQEWLGNGWMHIKEKPDIQRSILSSVDRKVIAGKSGESKLAHASSSDSRDLVKSVARYIESTADSVNVNGRNLGFVDLSKDDSLAHLRWKSSRKRGRGAGSSGQKMLHDENESKSSPNVVGPSAHRRFLIEKALKVDQDNCKCMGDPLFSSAVVKPLTSLVMSR